ncbi:LysR family transcriptional regulator [Bradyrhizobium sp. U87765 SZCCT0131]|uniref:LysR family transcriptional regulator n=1 Tax=unclassified Bradyrhizobium TaxID=2631580 RepID=UPI001BAA9D6A|nr:MULTISPECIES: LysR family transcriptional regulator [unclassified Bradyrhizobium]MBR1219157.1 LysR family transcriptional regulator [Bradyrhizobium sp. U87765 SZCCT0131]MBR1261808.1 LysR family transcriptional regulator [Bradyrhizobium sp. U87765 SZCCT0134]MBR1306339.1 LysR family transcriptional regulator [Bradyrhizobium sp. U87765 SZCCT0110]MBR1317590.1 LysR family transcriptional regulator [Bradyrhizobium sp. U87765 SZCCT0109]MBR1351292.1 LysR family transcriptional regulator [Bradyrhizo
MRTLRPAAPAADLNLDQLRSFRDVVALGSFSAAAERAGLSQPAVSLKVRALERRLGVTLIERVGRRATPTAAGAELLAHAARIETEVAAACEAMAHHATGALGRVRLGTGATACIFLLPPLLRDLRRRLPGLDISVTTGDAGDVVKAVEDNAIDIGLVALPASGRALDVTPVLDDPFMVIAPPKTALPARVTPATLAALPVLLPGGNTRRLVEDWFAASGVSLRPVMQLASVEAIKELVAAGLGCAVLPGMALRRDGGARSAATRSLVIRPLSPKLQRTLAVVIRRDRPLHRGLRETLAALKALPRAP